MTSNKLPLGSLIVVSGANGYIGSHIVDQLLAKGYKVRGTVRDSARARWAQEFFDGRHGAGRFSLVSVPDVSKPGAFDEAVKGAAGFAHVASDVSFGTDPNAVITPVVASVREALAASAKEPAMRSFVLTSSSTAIDFPRPNVKYHITKDMWNDESVKLAWAETYDNEEQRQFAVYAASKTLGERALWDFASERQPHFTVNSVLPNMNWGRILNRQNQNGSTAGWLHGMLDDKAWPKLKNFPPQYFVHVADTAALHVAVLTDLSLDRERLLAYAAPFNWYEAVTTIKRLRPDLKLPTDVAADDPRDLTTVDNDRALEVLKKETGQSDWKSMEETLKENVSYF